MPRTVGLSLPLPFLRYGSRVASYPVVLRNHHGAHIFSYGLNTPSMADSRMGRAPMVVLLSFIEDNRLTRK